MDSIQLKIFPEVFTHANIIWWDFVNEFAFDVSLFDLDVNGLGGIFPSLGGEVSSIAEG